jgi:PPM family protein phosphatase
MSLASFLKRTISRQKYSYGFTTDVGKKRKQNQDAGGAFPELGLFLVSDGMGGHKGGEIASATAVSVICEKVKELTKSPNWDPSFVIEAAIQAANAAIFKLSEKKEELRGMGTTTTALLFKQNHLTIGHVGDSRCYYLKSNALWQATRDHSLVQEKLRAGLIKRKDIKTDRMKNVITRSVGFEPQVEVDLYRVTVTAGDCFLICSDGLSGLVEDPSILKILQTGVISEKKHQATTQRLVDAANQNGGDDNVTSVVVQVL